MTGEWSDYMSFSGRASRREFARVSLRLLYASIGVFVVAVLLLTQDLPVVGYVAVALIGALWISSVAVIARRLHDRNLSGWFALAIVILDLFGVALERYPIVYVPLVLANLWLLVELYFRRGTIGENRFGPDPLARPA